MPPVGFSKHSYLFPQDPCQREYTLQSMICGPWLHCSHQAWLYFMPCDMSTNWLKFVGFCSTFQMWHRSSDFNKSNNHLNIPRINWLRELNLESQRAMTGTAFHLFCSQRAPLHAEQPLDSRAQRKGGGVNVGNSSTVRLILTCPHACVLAHSWRLMPHLCSEPVQLHTFKLLHRQFWNGDCLQQQIKQNYLKLWS